MVLEAGGTIGHADLLDAEDGLAVGDLEPLPACEGIRPVLESAACV